MAKHILIVDDDPLFRVSTSFSLKTAGYDITTAANAAETLSAIQQSPPDIILLDIGLPEIDGLEVLRIIRQHAAIPTIFVTARRRELDEIVGLELGADDYITKPFDTDVLLAHIKAVLRRTTLQMPPRGLAVGDLYIDVKTHTVVLNGKVVEVSRKEFDLLHTMAQKPGEIFSIDDLMNQVWGEDWFGEVQTVYVHVRRLREKIEEDPAMPRRLLTVKGVGYKLVPARE